MQRERKVFWIKGPEGTIVESAATNEQEEQQQQQVLPPGARESRCECLCTNDGEQCWNNAVEHHTLCDECMNLHSTMNRMVCDCRCGAYTGSTRLTRCECGRNRTNGDSVPKPPDILFLILGPS